MIQLFNEEISLVTNSETPYLSPSVFGDYDDVCACFSTRLGGVSKGHLYSLNLGLNLGDERANVLENYNRFAKSIGVDSARFVAPKQVHELNVFKVDEDYLGNGIFKENVFTSADGLVTNEKNVFLTVYGADCVGLLFYDPIKKCIGTAHAGWKGTVYNIAHNVINKLTSEYNSRPEDLIVSIGPSICPSCFEIGLEVAEIFEQFYQAAYDRLYDVSDGYVQKTILKKGDESHSYANLWLANYVNLTNEGVLPKNIHLTGLCTKCHSDLLYSHRATGGKRGVQAGFIGLI